jgi:ApaG protein
MAAGERLRRPFAFIITLMNSCTTQGVTITATPEYLADQSEPGANRWVWAYHIHIQNDGAEVVRLLNRYWHITDARGKVEEVRGPGVVGKQPVLRPGEEFHYTSGVPLGTPSGFMRGAYEMLQMATGKTFQAEIPLFSLDLPMSNVRVN